MNKHIVEEALQANKEHLHALETYTHALETELEELDKLLDTVETIDDSDLDVGCFVTIAGSTRATAPIAMKELLSPESPFHEDALKRNRYQNLSEMRSWKDKEVQALAEAVQAESSRKHALDMQKRGSLALLNADARIAQIPGLDDENTDWDRIAEKVSAVSGTTRTARECEIRWLGGQHPIFNHGPWSGEEVVKLKSLTAESTDSPPDWVTIAEKLGTKRTPLDCMRHATLRKTHQWTADADKRLLKAIDMHGHENWHLVARYVSEDATPSQCSSRFQKTLDESIKHTAWTPEEDARLSAAVAAHGSSWVDVAANVPGRHNDQCRERWIEQLDPCINRSQWSEEEDRTLVDYIREHGNTRWKQTSEHLGNGRTEAMCRNRYAVLQRDANIVSTPAIGTGTQNAPSAESSKFVSGDYCLDSSFPPLHTLSAPLHAGSNPPNEFVFLEPVVSSNPESHQHHKPRPSQNKTRFKMMTGNTLPPNKPPSKKRKTRPHIARSDNASMETQYKE